MRIWSLRGLRILGWIRTEVEIPSGRTVTTGRSSWVGARQVAVGGEQLIGAQPRVKAAWSAQLARMATQVAATWV